jgi:hypothetical protein
MAILNAGEWVRKGDELTPTAIVMRCDEMVVVVVRGALREKRLNAPEGRCLASRDPEFCSEQPFGLVID